MSSTITSSLRQLIFIMTPAALGLLVLAPNILSAIFEWNGKFDAQSTLLSSRALMCYAPGLIVFSAAKVFVPAFYSMQDTKTPVRIGIYIVLLNLIMNIIFIFTLPEYWKHAGMAFSTVVAEALGMIALGILLTRRVKNIQWKKISHSLFRSLACALIMAAVAWLVAHYSLPKFELYFAAKPAQVASVLLAVTTGAITYFILCMSLKVPELGEIKSALRRK